MTSKTRYFIITSVLILAVGLGTGLVAYYAQGGGGLLGRSGPEELEYVPRDVAVVAYANVRDVMASEVRQRIRRVLPLSENGQREFQEMTGINIETDINYVVASLRPVQGTGPSGLVLARGLFDEVRIEALMREHGARVEDFAGKRLIVAEPTATRSDGLSLSFVQPGLVAFGSDPMVRTAIGLQKGGDNVTNNAELMDLVRSLDSSEAWAVGRFDVLTANGALPPQVATQIPPITWFSISGRIDSSLRASVRADMRDDEAANNFRDVVRGLMALAKLQSGNRPEFQALTESMQLGGTGKTVTLSFSVPGEVFDLLGANAPDRPTSPQ